MDNLDFNRGDAQEEQPRRVAKKSRRPFLVLAVAALLAGGAGTSPLSDRTYSTVPPTS